MHITDTWIHTTKNFDTTKDSSNLLILCGHQIRNQFYHLLIQSTPVWEAFMPDAPVKDLKNACFFLIILYISWLPPWIFLHKIKLPILCHSGKTVWGKTFETVFYLFHTMKLSFTCSLYNLNNDNVNVQERVLVIYHVFKRKNPKFCKYLSFSFSVWDLHKICVHI